MITNKRIFYLNSRNRESGTDSDFTYTLKLGDINPTEVVVLSANIPKSFYLFTDTTNTFILTEDAVDTTVTIPPVQFNFISLRTKLISLLNASSPNGWTYDITVRAATTEGEDGKYIFSVTGHSSQPSLTFATSCFEQLGFSRNTTYIFESNILTSPHVAKLQKEDTIYIHSNIAQNNGGTSILQEIYASASIDFTNIAWYNQAPEFYEKKIVSNDQNLFHFYLTNEDGDQIQLNGNNWNCTICVYARENKLLNLIKALAKEIFL